MTAVTSDKLFYQNIRRSDLERSLVQCWNFKLETFQSSTRLAKKVSFLISQAKERTLLEKPKICISLKVSTRQRTGRMSSNNYCRFLFNINSIKRASTGRASNGRASNGKASNGKASKLFQIVSETFREESNRYLEPIRKSITSDQAASNEQHRVYHQYQMASGGQHSIQTVHISGTYQVPVQNNSKFSFQQVFINILISISSLPFHLCLPDVFLGSYAFFRNIVNGLYFPLATTKLLVCLEHHIRLGEREFGGLRHHSKEIFFLMFFGLRVAARKT